VLIRLQKKLKPLARKLSFAFVGLWFFSVASPCVLAAGACPPGMVMSVSAHQETDTPNLVGAPCSELTKYGCQLPERISPPESSVPSDFTIVPILLTLLPVIPEPLLLVTMRYVVEESAPVTFTPQHIPHTILLV
jgi:hypothetical protein